ncbi:lytic transglycosylase [Gemmobacter aquarius]|uniref:Lytic transglycosylase n=1 Tax=Paragemmobacter aquarius TaxID=2169400 RepID=A0A2S0ULM9_9RHOB|nr:lytic transglycosylase domain-containing protein [Gemmobacter aquarius]AWB48712.1 lytic transglycosylase [Gemmobacter aquarius]
MVIKRVRAGVVAGVAIFAALPVFAEGFILSTGAPKSRAEIFASQTRLMDRKLAKQYSGSAKLRPDFDGLQDDIPLPAYRGNYRGEYLETAKAAARAHDVPEDLFLRLVQQESGWNPGAVSPKGATGLAQLMPGTADLLGVDIDDPEENLRGGARYLRMMYDKFGSWKLALAAYNAGPKAVEAAGGVPDFDETQNYVKAILG